MHRKRKHGLLTVTGTYEGGREGEREKRETEGIAEIVLLL